MFLFLKKALSCGVHLVVEVAAETVADSLLNLVSELF